MAQAGQAWAGEGVGAREWRLLAAAPPTAGALRCRRPGPRPRVLRRRRLERGHADGAAHYDGHGHLQVRGGRVGPLRSRGTYVQGSRGDPPPCCPASCRALGQRHTLSPPRRDTHTHTLTCTWQHHPALTHPLRHHRHGPPRDQQRHVADAPHKARPRRAGDLSGAGGRAGGRREERRGRCWGRRRPPRPDRRPLALSRRGAGPALTRARHSRRGGASRGRGGSMSTAGSVQTQTQAPAARRAAAPSCARAGGRGKSGIAASVAASPWRQLPAGLVRAGGARRHPALLRHACTHLTKPRRCRR